MRGSPGVPSLGLDDADASFIASRRARRGASLASEVAVSVENDVRECGAARVVVRRATSTVLALGRSALVTVWSLRV